MKLSQAKRERLKHLQKEIAAYVLATSEIPECISLYKADFVLLKEADLLLMPEINKTKYYVEEVKKFIEVKRLNQ
jgi:hypothetical protein